MAPERMVVVDSRTGCAGHGFMAVAATNAIAGGADLAGAVAAAQAMRENLKIIVMVDTLEYLRRGGRIGAAQAWIGATLKVKPILTIEGEMQPVERVRTASRAFERLVAHLEQRRENGCDAFAIQHVQAVDEAERLAERGRQIFGRDPELISEIGPVIGTHTGPGILGVTGLRTDLLGPF
jgi:DegV family protein with EDD domain